MLWVPIRSASSEYQKICFVEKEEKYVDIPAYLVLCLFATHLLVFSCFFFVFFFLIWVLRPFQEYFTYIEPIVHRRWAKTGEPGEKPPDHP